MAVTLQSPENASKSSAAANKQPRFEKKGAMRGLHDNTLVSFLAIWPQRRTCTLPPPRPSSTRTRLLLPAREPSARGSSSRALDAGVSLVGTALLTRQRRSGICRVSWRRVVLRGSGSLFVRWRWSRAFVGPVACDVVAARGDHRGLFPRT